MSTTQSSNKMETPPASPPTFSKSGPSCDPSPPALTGTTSLSSEAMGSPQRRSSELSGEDIIGHRRSRTPSTPVPTTAEAFPPAPRAYGTPGRSGPGGPGMPTTHILQAHHGHHLTSDLTPVISNSNITYVDSHVPFRGSRPGMPGLTTAPGRQGDFMVVSPAGDAFGVPRGGPGRLSSSAAALLGSDGMDGEGISSSVSMGLKQRRSHMPLPRAGLPPVKRSSSSGNSEAFLRLSSVGSTESSLQGEHLGISPSTPSTAAMEGADGLGLVGERLAMPSYSSMYSEDESSVDTSGGSGNGRAGIFQQKGKQDTHGQLPEGLAPIELMPDRKYFSFQGASQYKRTVGGSGDDGPQTRLETIPSPSRIGRPPASHIKGTHQPTLATMHNQDGQKHQYLPVLRSQHGVTEMAKAEELDAIFKAPRRKQQPQVVSPHTPASVVDLRDVREGQGVPMMVTEVVQQPQLSLSYPSREDGDEEDDTDNIPPPYPVESQWSIPSIRLANHVNQSGVSNSLLNSHGYSYGDFSEYTDDDGASLGSESYYSFLQDDDDASLSSRGSSLDASARRRRISYGMMQFQRKERMDRLALEGGFGTSSPPAVAPSSSLVEKIQGISIENDATPDSTFDTSAMESSAIDNSASANESKVSLPPSMIIPQPLPRRDLHAEMPSQLNVPSNIPASNANLDRQPAMAEELRVPRSRRRGGRSSRRKEAAVEWIQDLQSQSNDVQLIAESASSKFLTGEGATMALGCGETGSKIATTDMAVGGGMNAEDVTKALGMPHPLCRSSTIEAGPFTVHRGAFGQTSSRDNMGVGLESNNSIALTSSGSGD